MQNKIDIKTLILGVALATILILSVAADSKQPSPTSYGGRFHLEVSEHYAFKIDTVTGQIWKSRVSDMSSEFMAPNNTLR